MLSSHESLKLLKICWQCKCWKTSPGASWPVIHSDFLIRSLGQEDPLEKEMAPHSSILPWRTPWTEEPGGLQPTGSQRVGPDWAISLSLFTETLPVPTCLLWNPLIMKIHLSKVKQAFPDNHQELKELAQHLTGAEDTDVRAQTHPAENDDIQFWPSVFSIIHK